MDIEEDREMEEKAAKLQKTDVRNTVLCETQFLYLFIDRANLSLAGHGCHHGFPEEVVLAIWHE